MSINESSEASAADNEGGVLEVAKEKVTGLIDTVKGRIQEYNEANGELPHTDT